MIDVKKSILALAQNEVDFIVIGGVALSLHSSAYVTYDIDFCYSRSKENLDKLVGALSPFKPRPRGFPADLPFIWDRSTLNNATNFTLETSIGDVDLLGEVSGIGTYRDGLEFAETWNVYDHEIKLLSVAGLIKAKEAAGREKDVAGLKVLYALQEALSDED